MMKRDVFLAASGMTFAAALLPAFAGAAETTLTLTTPTGAIAGTLTLPDKSTPVPCVLIIAGSGPTDRDGNSPLMASKDDAYKLLANALAARGYASVRYDKRGIGASVAAAPPEDKLRFDTYVDDATAWLRQLRRDDRFSKLIVAGHSEGSLIGMIAARQSGADAFVSLEGAGRTAPVVLLEQLKPKLPPEQYELSERIIASLQNGNTMPLPEGSPAYMRALFRDSVQPYLISWFTYDPAVEIAKLRVPVTIVQGTADVQITAADAELLKKNAPGARLATVDGLNHMLRYAPDTSSQAAILKGYGDASLPIDPKVVELITTAL